MWGLCAGHVNAYETLEEAALREAEEELGIKFSTKELQAFSERKINLKATNSHITYFYYIKCNKHEEEFKIQEEELSEVKWFFIDDVIKLIDVNDTSIVFGQNMKDRFIKLKYLIN